MSLEPTSARAVLIVGMGGLGLPIANLLASSPRVARLTLLDDDLVETSNLHRQTFYAAADVGRPKVDAAADALAERLASATHQPLVVPQRGRFLPNTALELASSHDLIVEGADNLATKFLVADAAALAHVPSVHAGVTGWNGWAMASLPHEAACLRCLFEDLPATRVETCATAGVLGPVVGVVAALEAALALRLLANDRPHGEVHAYEGLAGRLRTSRILRRPNCPLCGGVIHDLDRSRYLAPCAA